MENLIWDGSGVPVFLEKFLLPLCVMGIGILCLTNPMHFDAVQRITGGIALVCVAYFVSHTIHLRNEAAQTTIAQPAVQTTTPVQAGPAPDAAAPPTATAPQANHAGPTPKTPSKDHKPGPALLSPPTAAAPAPGPATRPGNKFTQNIGGNNNVGIQGEQITISPVPLPPPERIFSEQRYNAFVQELSKAPSKVVISIVGADKETATFGSQVANGFHQAGWNIVAFNRIGQMTNVINDTVLNGEGLNCAGDIGEVATVTEAFATAGLQCNIEPGYFIPNPRNKEAHVVVVIGKRTY